jgi:hypothetical protein
MEASRIPRFWGLWLWVLWLTALRLTPNAQAQAPSTLTGDGILIEVTSGTYPLASYGYSVFLPANAGNSYQLIGIYGGANNNGTYSYAATGPNSGQIIVSDVTDSATEQVGLAFTSATQGSFSVATISPPGYSQSGYFVAALGSALGSIAGKSVYCVVSDGLYPFANTGNGILVFSPSGNTYTVTGSGGVANSSGTCAYSLVNRSTGLLSINDSVSGSSAVYLGFSTARTGGYAIKQSSTGGFQIGSFTVLDTTPPTVTITSPTSGQQWSNAVFTVTGTAADDVQVAAVYYQVNGQGWNLATTSNNWANWSGTVTLQPGTNIIQAYSVDTSANNSSISSQNMYYAVVAPMTVQTNGLGTVSPNYNGQLLEIGKSYSMTATAGAGFAFTNWTLLTNGVVEAVTNGATLNFVMQSNLTAEADFLDVTKPILTITAPIANQKMTNALANITGSASDNSKVTGVWYQLNNGNWDAVSTTNNFTNWFKLVTLIAGTNTVKAYAMDLAGNASLTNSVSFISSNTFNLRLLLTNPPVLSSGLTMNLQASLGLRGQVQFSTNLSNWTTFDGFYASNASLTIHDSAATNSNKRFYRAFATP